MTDSIYGAPLYPPPRRRRLPAFVIVLLTLAVVAAAAGGGYLVYRGTRPAPVTIDGSVTLTSGVDGGNDCQGSEGYDDIREGTSVVVHDSAGKVIATGELSAGVGEDVITSQIATSCRFAFRVPDVPREKFYGIEVSHRGTVTFTATQVDDGQVALSLGS
jgi:hypothetical protein